MFKIHIPLDYIYCFRVFHGEILIVNTQGNLITVSNIAWKSMKCSDEKLQHRWVLLEHADISWSSVLVIFWLQLCSNLWLVVILIRYLNCYGIFGNALSYPTDSRRTIYASITGWLLSIFYIHLVVEWSAPSCYLQWPILLTWVNLNPSMDK